MLLIKILPVLSDNYIFIIHDQSSGETVCVDPAEADPVLKCLEEENWNLSAIWNTHHHPDHTGGNLELKETTGCKIFGPEKGLRAIPGIDKILTEQDTLSLGKHSVQILETPGHTKKAVSYFIKKENILFCGDTLFSLGCGRMFEGTPEEFWNSLKKIKSLPSETLVYCTHEYTLANSHFARSVEPQNEELLSYQRKVQEKRDQNHSTVPSILKTEILTNPFLRTGDEKLQKTLGLSGSEEWLVFKKLRELKDSY